MSLSSHRRVYIFHLIALLVAVSLASLHFCECFPGSDSQASASPPLGALFDKGLDRKQDIEIVPQIGGRPAVGSREVVATTAKLGRAKTLPERNLKSPTTRGGRSLEVSADATSKTAAPPDMEVEALAAFKAAITSDPSNALRSWIVRPGDVNNSDTCTGWVGVTCSPQFPNHVVALNLVNLQLVGSLGSVLPKLTNLTFLQRLDLSVNVFIGSIPGESLTNFSHLTYLNLSSNVVTGEIPSEVGQLVSLQDLDVSINNMTGPIPNSLGNCSLLRFIEVGHNSLEGDIPSWIGTSSVLEYLDVSFNSLSGSIPTAIGNCSSLLLLHLNNNFHIGGVIPQEMSMLKQFQSFSADQVYDLSGSFPPWISNLTSLVYFSLYENNIYGEIPDTIGQLEFLKVLNVAVNQFITGVIPSSIYNLTSLVTFQIEGTNVSGEIPSQIGQLSNLKVLGLAQNQITGVLPSSLANCSALTHLEVGINPMDPQPVPSWIESLTNLTDLYLSTMNLHGPISDVNIGKLINLRFLAMSDNYLTGTIPTALSNCTYLSQVDLTSNQFTGNIPPELGVLSYMTTFYSHENDLTGPFPEIIANWTHLAFLSIEDNHLSGPLEGRVTRIDQLQQLTDFSIWNNDFEGPIPEVIGNWTSIQKLFLNGNQFTGPIPAALGNLTSLQTLNLSNNNLQGPIPVTLFNSGPQMIVLDLSLNSLEGTIPLEIGQLSQLTNLVLAVNMFSGIVPDSLGNCSKMNLLDLSLNQFEGSLPAAAMSKMAASLTNLNLSRNLFSGSWPSQFGDLTVVQNINVSFNNISGSIPLGLGQCGNLNFLDISMNNLSGEIPEDLGSLPHLQFFNASFNFFTGPIPQSGLFNSNLINESSFLGNPGLCGSVTTLGLNHQACPAIPLNVTSHGRRCKGFSCKQVWIPVVVVSSLLVLAGLGILGRTRLGSTGDHAKTQVLLVNLAAHRRFTKQDVQRTIDDPSGDNVIGAGAKSIVYRGVLRGGEMFALKKLLPKTDDHVNRGDPSSIDANELVKEAKILAMLQHKSILKCLSFYSDLDHKALILEYMSEGSLHAHLHEVEPCKLTWRRRLKIAMGVAQGMKYLHHDFPEPLIHRDLKPGNIFLDENFEPKIGDFGISKFVGTQRDGEASASTFCGTVGYIPPEYASQVWVSTKGDVYSYGMIVIELLTRKQPCSTDDVDDQGRDVRSWVMGSFHERPFELLDPSLLEECRLQNVVKEQMMLLLRIGLFCTRADPQSRPSMMDVVRMLEYTINLGVEPVIRRTVEELANEIHPETWMTQDPIVEGEEFSSNR